MKENQKNNFNLIVLAIGMFLSMMAILFGALYNLYIFLIGFFLIATLLHYCWCRKRFNGSMYWK